jgi:DNA-binding XRE family transcriptional regulator
MFDHSWRKVLAALEESPIGAEHFARTLFATRDSLQSEADRERLDALVSALFPYTFFGDACRHLFGHYLWGTLDPADDPISAASYYPIWLRGPHEHPQSKEEREIYREWKLSGRCFDLAYLKRKRGELRAELDVISDTSRKPQYLKLKLRAIRQTLEVSQSRIAQLLRLHDSSDVSEYERGRRTPSLGRLLHYSRIAGIPLEHIVDDDLDLETFRKELMLVKQARVMSPTCRFW